jgi:outer membrane usher protein
MYKLLRLSSLALTLSCFSSTLQAQAIDTLPPAPTAMPAPKQTTYYLTLIVNGQADKEIVPVLYRDHDYFVEAGVLARNHVRTERKNGLINVSTLADVNVAYKAQQQVLQLTVPAHWLPEQTINTHTNNPRYPALSSVGFIQNYEAYYLRPADNIASVTTWLEQRLFTPFGYLTNTGTYRKFLSSTNNDEGYLRYDTFWRYINESHMVSIQAGDFISDSLTWSNSNRMGGIRISRQFSVRPDLITYPLLQYSGSAAVPTSVELFINGAKAGSNEINAGPFTLNNVPYISGRGEAVIVTTDALGRQVETTVPFYVSNRLLKKGLSDFDFSLGKLRKNFGLDNFSYGAAAFSGIYRYGLNDQLTLSGHTEISKNLRLAGFGTDFTVGYWGTVSSSYSRSSSTIDTEKRQGYQASLAYSYLTSGFNIAAQHTRRSGQFDDLTSATNGFKLSRQINQLTLTTMPFGKKNGTLGVGYFDLRDDTGQKTRILNLSYNRPFTQYSTLNISLNKSLGNPGISAQVQVTIPFGYGASGSVGLQKENVGSVAKRISASQSAPSSGGLGWNAGYSYGDSQYYAGDISWKGARATMNGGAYGDRKNSNIWGSLSGAFIWMDNALFATNKINDAFIIVSTDGHKDVIVRYENQPIGKTNDSGHVLIPWVSAYHPGKIDINTLDLPINILADSVEKKVAVKQSSGVIVSFPLHTVRSMISRIKDERGQYLPLGTPVHVENTALSTIVGHDGLVYFANLAPVSKLIATLPNQRQCDMTVILPEANNGAEIPPLTCVVNMPVAQEKSP